MSNVNDYIEKYLEYYLDSKFEPSFAVLLHGEWGCGKTWFIKNFLKNYCRKKRYKKADYKDPFLYVSLYGLSSFSEIEDQIFQQLHPILSSKPVVLTGKILKGALRSSFKVDLNGDNKSDGSIKAQIPDINLPDYLKNTEERILVFDDLERSSMSILQVLGYINSFVEHQNRKVIILANEEEIEKIKSENVNIDYKRIKEKLVGKSFKINHDFDTAFSVFIEKLETEEVRELLKNKQQIIYDIFSTANYKNLRHLQQSFWEFERLYSEIDDQFKKIARIKGDGSLYLFNSTRP